ncbi:hypothetical protein, conserved [Leishmania donovani]|uniref:Acyl CoA binding family protein n=1 Tax=Leishmania donovani TaxID=5661 RepID=E9BV43_LEIDO|nr:hypothetical protein, conserved [Leishmania donovani]TPP53348.1 Acyl CoA binding family protein [Leishmania donovani]CBZ39122.1 hypothetical protein, conserved [Leishmania donovani]
MELSFPDKYYEVAKYFDYYIGNLEESPLLSDAQRLMFYALRQQADHGQCTTAAPSFWYSRERHKHQAWKQLGRMSNFEAMVFFVQQFEQLLTQLENSTGQPAPTSGAAARAGGVDWPSRLREMKSKTAPNPGNSPHSSEALASGGARANNDILAVRQGPSPATAGEEACRESPPSKLSAAEMADWDADVLSHSGATVENIRYLATELMRARHAFRQLLEKSAPSHAEQNGTGTSTNGPPIRAGRTCLTPSGAAPAAPGPPLKPIWCSNDSAARVPIVPPPVRPSARSMTEAAVRDSCGAPQSKKMPVATDRPVSPSALSTWFNW